MVPDILCIKSRFVYIIQGAACWRDDLNGDLEESELDLVELQAELEHIPERAKFLCCHYCGYYSAGTSFCRPNDDVNFSEHGDQLITRAIQISVQEEDEELRAQEEAEQKDVEEALRRSFSSWPEYLLFLDAMQVFYVLHQG